MPAAKLIVSSTSKTTRGGRRRRDRKMTIRMHRNTTMGALRTRMMFVTMLLLFLRVAVPDHHGSCFGLSTGSGSRIRKNNPNTNMNTDVTTTTMRLTPRAVAVFALLESSKKQQQTTTTTKNRKDTSNIALRLLENNNPSYLQLDARDRAFARLLLSTSERRYGQLDAIIASFQHKNKKNTKTNTKNENENENNDKNNQNDDDDEKKKSNKKKKTTGKVRTRRLCIYTTYLSFSFLCLISLLLTNIYSITFFSFLSMVSICSISISYTLSISLSICNTIIHIISHEYRTF